MRSHGVPNFPDPIRSGNDVTFAVGSGTAVNMGSPAFQAARTTTAPSNSAGYSAMLGHDGVFFAIPSTVNLRSPAARQAEIACHFGGRVGQPTGNAGWGQDFPARARGKIRVGSSRRTTYPRRSLRLHVAMCGRRLSGRWGILA
jgi:hypothetical protein